MTHAARWNATAPAIVLATTFVISSLAALAPDKAAWAQGVPAPMMRQNTEAEASKLLDDTLAADPERIARAKAKAEEAPPQTADPKELAEFYRQRAIEAQIAGRQAQAMRDFGQAVVHAEQAPGFNLAELYHLLAQAQGNMARRVAAYRSAQKAIEATPQVNRMRSIPHYFYLAAQAAIAGHLDVAERALGDARKLVEQMSTMRGAQVEGRQMSEISMVNAQGMLHQARGQYVEAEDFFRRAVAQAETNANPRFQALVNRMRMGLTRNYIAQGRLAEAENEARVVLASYQRQGGAKGLLTAQGLTTLAAVMTEQGRLGEAEGLARKALELAQVGGMKAYGPIRINLANVLALQGRWAEAWQEFETTRQGLSNAPEELEVHLRNNLALPIVMIKTGRAAEAVRMLGAQVQRQLAALGDKDYGTAELRGIYAMALAESGQRDQALAEFGQAVPVLLSRSREADDDASSGTARDQRLRLILEANMRLTAERDGAAAAAEVFQLAEAARGRSVARALAASAARAAASNPALAALARREQDAQQQVSALNGLLANAISARADEQDAGAVKALRERIDRLRAERAGAMEEIEAKFPDYAGLVNPKPASIEAARKHLAGDEALISLYSAEDRTYGWAVPAQGAPAFVAWGVGRAELETLVAALRRALDPAADTLEAIPAFDLAAAHKLYAGLIQPVEAGWRTAKSLLVVPHGPLGQISLALLPTAPAQLAAAKGEPFANYRQVPWLIRKVAVAQLPSVASLATLRALPAGNATRRPFVGFGDPLFSREQAAEAAQQTAQVTMRGGKIKLRSAPKSDPNVTAELAQLPRLPETADEVRGVALALKADPSVDLHLGATATKATVGRTDLANYRVVMFATHGLVPGDLTGLGQPALALTSPAVSPDGGNGLLTMEDILGLKLDADWVVLSACNTASGQGAGAEAISGLGRAFFYAGTRALLVSNWPVETTSALKLTTDLFALQAKDPALTRAEALRQAMVGLIDGPGMADAAGKPVFSYAHPIFWAAFTLVGDGGR
jgi:CHAT domain-containing protein